MSDSGYSAPAPVAYAAWLKRVLAYLIDYALFIPGAIVYVIGGQMESFIVIALGGLIMLGVFIWNTVLQGGNTGWTIGKGVIGIRLVSEATGQPIGAGMAFVRQLAHIVDSLPCDIGYLWPLWDAKRQTFADKIMKTVVVVQSKSA